MIPNSMARLEAAQRVRQPPASASEAGRLHVMLGAAYAGTDAGSFASGVDLSRMNQTLA
jgi:hypothetical protein